MMLIRVWDGERVCWRDAGTLLVSGAYQGLYHIWLVVAEGLRSIENICHVVTLEHLQDHGGGTEGAAPATSIPGWRSTHVSGEKMAQVHLGAPTIPLSPSILASHKMPQSRGSYPRTLPNWGT